MTNKTTDDIVPSQDTKTRTAMFDQWQNNKRDIPTHENCDIESIMNDLHQIVSNTIKLTDFVGVQPMTHPVGMAYILTLQSPKPKSQTSKVLEIVSAAVEAQHKVLPLNLSLDMLNDNATIGTIDLKNEILQAASMEICAAFHNEYMDIIYQNSTYVDYRIDLEEDPEVIIHKLQDACHTVGINSSRGNANKIVLPYELYCYILPTMQSMHWFTATDSPTGFSDLLHVGMLFGDKDIYVSIRNTLVLIGYKGPHGETDTGILHCPFQINPSLSTNSITYEPIIRLSANYGTHIVPNAKDYYVSIQVR